MATVNLIPTYISVLEIKRDTATQRIAKRNASLFTDCVPWAFSQNVVG